ncbi:MULTISPECIES: hypothetical protein [Paenibacillus]|uniref:hypothetical protein n=1 Tax=Paenibacillus TaxID=44249 RepID=UPI00096F8F8B|nr:hypothetical protein [Paenibacillus odorifer]OME41419.1 hypothetical protein BSK58_14910 [Paenibacillus odorifer]
MNAEKQALIALGLDIYKNELPVGTHFSAANSTMRDKIVELFGSDRITHKEMRRNKPEFFEIIEEVLDVSVQEGLKEEGFFQQLVEYRDLNLGDTNVFTIPDRNLFDVAMVSEGNNNIRRQRIDSDSITVNANVYAVKIYEELNRFLSGAINWVELVNRVKESFKQKILTDIYTSFRNAYSKLPAVFAKTGTYDSETMTDLIAHVEASSGKVMVVGTKKALKKYAPTHVSEVSKDIFNEQGYFTVVDGTPVLALTQIHKPSTFDFILDDNELYVIPVVGTKPVKMVREGGTMIYDGTTNNSADETIEYMIKQRYGINVILSSYFGIYRFS